MQWLLGMPARVRGFCQFGRFHKIEVEDNVTAYLEWPDGATGVFVSSTGEAPGDEPVRNRRHARQAGAGKRPAHFHPQRGGHDRVQPDGPAGFRPAGRAECGDSVRERAHPHAILMQNFVNAILDGEPLIAPGEEGIHSVELANAMVYSSLLGQPVELPMDGAAWEKLNQLIADQKFEKKVAPVSAEDFASSFKR